MALMTCEHCLKRFELRELEYNGLKSRLVGPVTCTKCGHVNNAQLNKPPGPSPKKYAQENMGNPYKTLPPNDDESITYIRDEVPQPKPVATQHIPARQEHPVNATTPIHHGESVHAPMQKNNLPTFAKQSANGRNATPQERTQGKATRSLGQRLSNLDSRYYVYGGLASVVLGLLLLSAINPSADAGSQPPLASNPVIQADVEAATPPLEQNTEPQKVKPTPIEPEVGPTPSIPEPESQQP